jgi:hypothetical protein
LSAKSQLLRDVRNHTADRVCKVIEDTMHLCDMAFLPRQHGANILVHSFMAAFVQLIACSDADPDEITKQIAQRIKEKRETECVKCDCRQ